MIGPDEIGRLVPYLDTSQEVRYPVLGALYHPPGGIVRHDAVVWRYARGADADGVHIHQHTSTSTLWTAKSVASSPTRAGSTPAWW